MAKCPVAKESYLLCYWSFWRENRKSPRLDCDFFTMRGRPLVFKIKNRHEKIYTAGDVTAMLDKIFEKIHGKE